MKTSFKQTAMAVAIAGILSTPALADGDINCSVAGACADNSQYMGDVYDSDSSGSTNVSKQVIDRSPTTNTGGNTVDATVDSRLQQSNNQVDLSGARQSATGGAATGNRNDLSNFGNAASDSYSNSGGNVLGNDSRNSNTVNPTINPSFSDVGGQGGQGGMGGAGGNGYATGGMAASGVLDSGNSNIGDVSGIDGDINNRAFGGAGGDARQGQIGINDQGQGQEQGIDSTIRSNNTNNLGQDIDRSGNSANRNDNNSRANSNQAQGIDRSGNSSNRNANAQGQSSSNRNAANQGQSSTNKNDSKASGNKTSFTDKSTQTSTYKSFVLIPPPLPGTPPSVVSNGQVIHSVSACQTLQAVVSRDVQGKFYGLVTDSDVNLGETDRLVPVTHKGQRVLYWQKMLPNGDIALIGSQVHTWAVPVNISGARQIGLGGGNYGAQGQGTLGSSSAMNQLVVHHEVQECNAGIIKYQIADEVTNISE